MGFMDKLKDAGSKVLKTALVIAATGYGNVIDGKYKGYKVALDSAYTELVFVKPCCEDIKCNPRTDIKTFYTDDDLTSTKSYHNLIIEYNNGETSHILISIDQSKPSLEKEYEATATLLELLARKVPDITEDTKHWVNLIMRYAGRKPMF